MWLRAAIQSTGELNICAPAQAPMLCLLMRCHIINIVIYQGARYYSCRNINATFKDAPLSNALMAVLMNLFIFLSNDILVCIR